MADDKKADDKKSEPKAEPTLEFRWFHPKGQIATARTLQQLWSDDEWRDVSIVNEEDVSEKE